MKIEELDNNFKNEKIESGLDIVYYDIPMSHNFFNRLFN